MFKGDEVMRSDRGAYECEIVIRKTVKVQGHEMDQASDNLDDLIHNIQFNPMLYDCYDTSGKMEYDVVSMKKLEREDIPVISS